MMTIEAILEHLLFGILVTAAVLVGFGPAYASVADTSGQVLAFPGAEGFGRFATGGRGGRVIEVTNLNDDFNPGSLRYALSQSGPRIIVFRVSGTIMLQSDLDITNDDLTIAGQTAPGIGICVGNHTVQLKASNAIIRYMRFRIGDLTREPDDSFWGRDQKSVIIDHCSISWAMDENGSWYDNTKFTMQWCINSESLYHSYHPKGNHGYGGIWGGMGATFHHNLLADNTSRNPRFNGARYNTTHATELVDFRNNVIFNWAFNSAYGGESGNQNMINNYFKPGPATRTGNISYRIVNPYDSVGQTTGYSKWYVDGNFMEGSLTVTSDNWNGGVQPYYAAIPLDSFRLDSPLPAAPVYTQSAQEAFDSVIANAGDNFPARDSVDLRIVQEVITGYAPYGASYGGGGKGIIDSQSDVGGWPFLLSSEPPADSDHDGMPDGWELAHGLNPNDSADSREVGDDGYTMIEVYVNTLVSGGLTKMLPRLKLPASFRLEQNYPNPFNPTTTIQLEVPSSGFVSLKVYDVLGREVKILVSEVKKMGRYEVQFDASGLASGVYFYRIKAGNFAKTMKLMVMK